MSLRHLQSLKITLSPTALTELDTIVGYFDMSRSRFLRREIEQLLSDYSQCSTVDDFQRVYVKRASA